jgi:hypothetical protein
LDYITLDQNNNNNNHIPPLVPPHQICITTLSDSPSRSSAEANHNHRWPFSLFFNFFQPPKCRDFSNVAEQTLPNMRRYAQIHGYTFLDPDTSLLDLSRPPAWSKIKAVQSALNTNQCRYVLWLDADVVITNSTIRLEQIIPHPNPNDINHNNDNPKNITSMDLLVTSDRRFTANSGVWIISNSTWSRSFLDQWWNMRNYVRSKGLSLSGDNDAFGALIRQYQQPQHHVHMLPARCHLNSFGVFVPSYSPPSQFQEHVGSTDFYHAGDFIAHASGIDQKDVGIQFLLQRAK